MQKIKFIRLALILFGIIGIGIGSALLFFPVAFESSVGIVLAADSSLLSEMRAFGGILLVGGIIIMFGAFNSKITYLSLVLACLLYLSIGLSRLVGMIVDGMPSESLVSATIVELIIGAICLWLILTGKKPQLQGAN